MLHRLLRSRLVLIAAAITLFLLTLSVFNRDRIQQKWQDIREKPEEVPEADKPHPPWKFKPNVIEETHAIVDSLPSAALGQLPAVPAWNAPGHHSSNKSPLLIGFTRNWRLLQQAVVSYITSGWPPGDIFVVENTGVLDSNKKGKLNLQNPFFLNYTRLEQLGVNVIRTPTLLNFAQLQNFYLNYAVENDVKGYFWSHMDVMSLSDETKEKSVYARAMDAYDEYFGQTAKKWCGIWFAYDRLTLVNTAAYIDAGGWDTFIGYYMTDCDFHERLFMKGYEFITGDVGFIYDVGRSVDDLKVLYREGAEKGDQGYYDLISEYDGIQREKNENKDGRNFWQGRQDGGQGDPFYRYSKGFEQAIQKSIQQGRDMYSEKWGHRDCDLIRSGLTADMAWKVERDWP